MLIPIFTTHFIQARFKQARLPCKLNSCIILYFILLSMVQAHATYREIEEVWFRGYGSVPFGPFAWAQPMRATKWARDTGSTLSLWRRSCIQNFHPKTTFMLWVTVAQSFYPNLFFPLNIVGSHWPTPSASPHLGEPPNGLKFLTKGNQLKKTLFFSKIMLKAYQTLP